MVSKKERNNLQCCLCPLRLSYLKVWVIWTFIFILNCTTNVCIFFSLWESTGKLLNLKLVLHRLITCIHLILFRLWQNYKKSFHLADFTSNGYWSSPHYLSWQHQLLFGTVGLSWFHTLAYDLFSCWLWAVWLTEWLQYSSNATLWLLNPINCTSTSSERI